MAFSFGSTPQPSFKDSQAKECKQFLGHLLAVDVEHVAAPRSGCSRAADSIEAIYPRAGRWNTHLFGDAQHCRL